MDTIECFTDILCRIRRLEIVKAGSDTAFRERHLLKYIFPKAFGLKNIFEKESSDNPYRLPTFEDREDEIKVSYADNLYDEAQCQLDDL